MNVIPYLDLIAIQRIREKAKLSSLTLESALFHNAVPCAFGIINSSELYNIHLLFLGIILLFII